MGLPSVSNYIKILQKEKLIIKREEYGNFLWFAQRENNFFKKYKIADKLISLEKSQLINKLDDKYFYPTIILFGSSSLGEDIETSDIDLCIISENKKEIDLKKFEKKLNRNIQLFIFNKKDFQKLKEKSKELYSNIINGIVLRGLIE